MTSRFALAFCAIAVGSIARADDWPQFRGPDRTGVSKETGLLKVWPKDGLKPAWTFRNAGLGFSSVAVVKGVVYTLGTDQELKNDIILAIDEKTGKELWTAKIASRFTFPQNWWGDGPRSTPTIDGNYLYALGGYGDLICVDIANKGKEIWRTHLGKNLNGEIMSKWGYSESPLVDGDLLICTPGGRNGTLAALDKKTGKPVWRSKEWTQLAPYSSVVAADIHGLRQYIQTGYTGGAKGGNVSGVEAKTGKLLWSKPYFTGDSYVIGPTPIVHGASVYVTEENGCNLFEINAMQAASEKYKTKAKRRLKNNHGGVVLIDGKIYGHTDPEAWVCQDLMTGNDDWLERNDLKCGSGAITAAEGLLYLYTEDGELGLVQATPKEFTSISKFAIPEKSRIPEQKRGRDTKTWAHPVIANGVLYVRDTELIFAFKIAAK